MISRDPADAEKILSSQEWERIWRGFRPRYPGDSHFAQWAEWKLRRLHGSSTYDEWETRVEKAILGGLHDVSPEVRSLAALASASVLGSGERPGRN